MRNTIHILFCFFVNCTAAPASGFEPALYIISRKDGGIIVGPSFLGHSKAFSEAVFPTRGKQTMDVIAHIGLLYYHFMIGIQQDPMVMLKAMGRKGVVISFAGILLPLIAGMGTSILTFDGSEGQNVQSIVFIGFFCSITTFSVMSRTIAELNLLNSELGKLAISASMVNDIVAISLSMVNSAAKQTSFGLFLLVLLSFISFTALTLCAIRPAIMWVIRQTPEEGALKEGYLTVILCTVLVFGYLGDVLGLGATVGTLILGMAIPSGSTLGSALIERLDALVSGLFLPLFFATSGLKTDFSSMAEFKSWAYVKCIVLGWMGKLVGTLVASFFHGMTLFDSFLLGLVMNTKGIVELVSLNGVMEKKIVDEPSFHLMLLTVLIGSSMISPVVSLFYDPVRHQQYLPHKRRTIQNSNPNSELAILACVYDPYNVPAIINLIELSCPTKKNPICLYNLEIVELKARASPLLIAHNTMKNQSQSHSTTIVKAFQNYSKRSAGSVSCYSFTAIAPFNTVYQEICNLAEDKKVSFVVLPFHKRQTISGTMDPTNLAYCTINRNVLLHAPCSVGILIDRGLGGATDVSATHVSHLVVVLFLGGADDREALCCAARMAKHPLIRVTVLHLVPLDEDSAVGEESRVLEKELDVLLLSEFRQNHVNNPRIVYEEKVVKNVLETVDVIRCIGNACHLIIVGRGGSNKSPLIAGLDDWSEFPELGGVGDLLASSDFADAASVLVVQQYMGLRAHDYSLPVDLRMDLAGDRSPWGGLSSALVGSTQTSMPKPYFR